MFDYNHENISQNTFNKLFVASKDDLITDAEMVQICQYVCSGMCSLDHLISAQGKIILGHENCSEVCERFHYLYVTVIDDKRGCGWAILCDAEH